MKSQVNQYPSHSWGVNTAQNTKRKNIAKKNQKGREDEYKLSATYNHELPNNHSWLPTAPEYRWIHCWLHTSRPQRVLGELASLSWRDWRRCRSELRCWHIACGLCIRLVSSRLLRWSLPRLRPRDSELEPLRKAEEEPGGRVLVLLRGPFF